MNVGNDELFATDYFDFDGDGDMNEVISLDLDFGVRSKGAGVDMGAYEH